MYRLFVFMMMMSATLAQAQEFDLLIQDGHVIDPKNGLDGVMDVGIKAGRIAAVGADLSGSSATTVVDAAGLYVTPGLIDIHTHVFFGTEEDAYLSNSYEALPPDGFTFRSGVTTIVDTGGAGWRNFDQFKRQTIDRAKTRVLSLLNIVGHGMKGGVVEQNLSDMDPRMTALVARQHPGVVVGVKLAHFDGPDWTPTERAVEAGRQAGIPVMIDFGRSEPDLPIETLFTQHLRPGDIYTHAYAHVNNRMPIVNEQGRVYPYVVEAQKRGIVFDVGHGGGSFVWSQALPATRQGFWPNTISSDLHTGSMNSGMKTMDNLVSKFLNLGMPLPAAIEAATWKPAEVINRTDLGHLDIGAVADVAVFSLAEGDFGFIDTAGYRLDGNQRLTTELTLRAGDVVWDLNGISKPTAE